MVQPKSVKLAVLKPYLLLKSNGGEISLLEYLKKFQNDWGWDIRVWIALPESLKTHLPQFLNQFGAHLEGEAYQLEGIRCELSFSAQFHPSELAAQAPMEAFFLEQLNEFSPDEVWVH